MNDNEELDQEQAQDDLNNQMEEQQNKNRRKSKDHLGNVTKFLTDAAINGMKMLFSSPYGIVIVSVVIILIAVIVLIVILSKGTKTTNGVIGSVEEIISSTIIKDNVEISVSDDAKKLYQDKKSLLLMSLEDIDNMYEAFINSDDITSQTKKYMSYVIGQEEQAGNTGNTGNTGSSTGGSTSGAGDGTAVAGQPGAQHWPSKLEYYGYNQRFVSNGKTYNIYQQNCGWYKNEYYVATQAEVDKGTAKTIAKQGCCPTSMAICISGLLPEIDIDPSQTAKKMLDVTTSNDRSSAENSSKVFQQYGLKTNSTLDWNTIKKHLSNGNPGIISVHGGTYDGYNFANGGHLISILAINETQDKIYVGNPNGMAGGWVTVKSLTDASSGKWAVLVSK